MVAESTFVRDLLYFIKNDLNNNVTDPIASSRKSASAFIMTSYPQREVQYPLITIKSINYKATRAGMQIDAMDMTITLEVRIWARNVKERDTLFTDSFNRLRNLQFAASGSVDNNLHDFNLNSAVEVDEDNVKSKVMEVTYKFFDFT